MRVIAPPLVVRLPPSVMAPVIKIALPFVVKLPPRLIPEDPLYVMVPVAAAVAPCVTEVPVALTEVSGLVLPTAPVMVIAVPDKVREELPSIVLENRRVEPVSVAVPPVNVTAPFIEMGLLVVVKLFPRLIEVPV